MKSLLMNQNWRITSSSAEESKQITELWKWLSSPWCDDTKTLKNNVFIFLSHLHITQFIKIKRYVTCKQHILLSLNLLTKVHISAAGINMYSQGIFWQNANFAIKLSPLIKCAVGQVGKGVGENLPIRLTTPAAAWGVLWSIGAWLIWFIVIHTHNNCSWGSSPIKHNRLWCW